MSFDVDKHTIFLGVTGSHAYGMAREDSDVDVRGVCVPPRRLRESFYRTFEQFQTVNQRGSWGPNSEKAIERLLEHPTAASCYLRSDPFRRAQGVVDLCIYSIVKYVALGANSNPNILELLFMHEQDVLFSTEKWERLAEHRDLFLSKKCRHTYIGYAMSQLKRIKGHREWLLNPPKAPPTRAEFNLPDKSVMPADARNQIDEAVLKILRSWGAEDGLDDYITGAALDILRERMLEFQAAALRCSEEMLDEKAYDLAGASLGLSKDALYAIKMERKYRVARKQWQQYQRWKTERNEARAELESKFGFDTKHASHLIRLLRTGLEVLRGEGLKVRRDDGEELKAIRDGAWSYEELLEQAENLQQEMRSAVEISALPESPPREEIDDVLFSILDS